VETVELLRYGLYGLTLLLGVALIVWVLRGRRRNAPDDYEEEFTSPTAKPVIVLGGESGESIGTPGFGRSTLTTVRGMPSRRSMVEAIVGIQLPMHWAVEPATEVTSPFRITTQTESAGEMAATISDELVRLGYRVSPMTKTSARAVRDEDVLTVEVTVDDQTSHVSSLITHSGASGG